MTNGVTLAIGTYRRLGGGGLYPLTWDGADWTVGKPDADIADASWGITTADGYAFVEESDPGRITVTDRQLAVVDRWSSGGSAPCHLALAPDGDAIAVANYQDGRVGITGPDGPLAVYQGDEGGPDVERQDGPHAHWVGFDDDGRLIVVDLGSDRVRALAVAEGGSGDPVTLYQAPAGSGPRHLAFHPQLPVAYLVSELAATLTVLDRVAPDLWRARAILPTLPPGIEAGTLGGAIVIDAAGERLYVTNRGHDSVVAFAIDADGGVAFRGHRSSGGASPRALLLLEDAARLVVANEEGGSVGILTLDDAGDLTGDPLVIPIPGAVFAIRIDQEVS